MPLPFQKNTQKDDGMIVVTLDSPPLKKQEETDKKNVNQKDTKDKNIQEKTTQQQNTSSRVSPTQQILNVWAVIIFIWALYRHFYKTDFPIWADEFLIKPAIFILPLYFYISIREHKHFFNDLWLRKDGLLEDFIYGSFVGIILFGSGALINYIKLGSIIRPDSAIFSQSDMMQIFMAIGLYILVSIATSVSEEMLSRGFLLKRLYEQWNNIITAILVSSLLYFALRIPLLFTNPDMNGITLLYVMLTDFIFSFTVSFLYIQSKSLALPIIIHTFYTLSLYLFLV